VFQRRGENPRLFLCRRVGDVVSPVILVGLEVPANPVPFVPRHSGEGRNPFCSTQRRSKWVPAFAGTTMGWDLTPDPLDPISFSADSSIPKRGF
jgi:hypothetical protein